MYIKLGTVLLSEIFKKFNNCSQKYTKISDKIDNFSPRGRQLAI